MVCLRQGVFRKTFRAERSAGQTWDEEPGTFGPVPEKQQLGVAAGVHLDGWYQGASKYLVVFCSGWPWRSVTPMRLPEASVW